ncbi:MAG: cation transporter [Tannerella sp.]|jgi:Cu(I)/Ag(I) efflux system membrane fusion protein|nr:cation transporter [Tannerella sp.]
MKKAVILIGMVALLATGNVCAQAHDHGSHGSKRETVKVDADKAVQNADAGLVVQGSCGMCKARIEKTAKGIDGVTGASWDAKTKKLNLDFDGEKTSLDAISKALAQAGHDTDRHRADDKTYGALPQCCKYRK